MALRFLRIYSRKTEFSSVVRPSMTPSISLSNLNLLMYLLAKSTYFCCQKGQFRTHSLTKESFTFKAASSVLYGGLSMAILIRVTKSLALYCIELMCFSRGGIVYFFFSASARAFALASKASASCFSIAALSAASSCFFVAIF